jgi:hypothetical protein
MKRFALNELLAGALIALGLAGGTLALAADVTPMADDACVAHCDEEADKCMEEAGGDESKEKACDDRYDKCLDKCG